MENWKKVVSDDELEDLIHQYCVDFTALDREGRYDPITGRDKEIDDCILILLQKGRKNACFLAPAGVGKTATVVGLAQRINRGDVPDYLKNARVIEIELARMASGTTGPAEFHARFMPLCKGVAERYHDPKEPRTIMFIDEIHQIMPNCEGSSYKGLSDTMKPYLTAGDLLVLGATTLDEFRLYVATDPALDRRFQKIYLKQPTIVETYNIMKALRSGYEKHHNVTISDEQLMTIVHLTDEHMRRRTQPDKSIISMDSAMAYHVKEYGTDQQIKNDAIYYMIARETGLNPRALHDEKKLEQISEQVGMLEGRIKKNEIEEKAYDPNAMYRDVEMDPEFQSHLKKEKQKVEQELKESRKADRASASE